MGCVSSKLIKKEIKQQKQHGNNNNSGYVNHVVSLTSSTYGAFSLENVNDVVSTESESKPKNPSSHREEDPQAIININAWELMEGLEEEIPISNNPKKTPKPTPFLRGFVASDSRSPLKFLNQFGSPKTTLKKPLGKENKVQINNLVRGGVRRLDYSPKGIFKSSSPKNLKGSLISTKRNSFGSDRKSSSPLFDPELVSSYEKELSEEEEQIKRVVSTTAKTRRERKSLDSLNLLNMFESKCPPRGENCVVIYTTTLRGIRKTFEDCNKVRAIVESYCVCMRERDVSMDSGFKEELRKLMGTKQVQVPVVFVKGRLIGGVDDVLKLEEEEKLGVLLEGIPMALGVCEGCAGVRFVMCKECNGSCKVLDEKQKKTVKCDKCNENGILQCPICC